MLAKEMKCLRVPDEPIRVIDDMNDHDDNITDHWNDYDQLVKSKRIQKAFRNYPTRGQDRKNG